MTDYEPVFDAAPLLERLDRIIGLLEATLIPRAIDTQPSEAEPDTVRRRDDFSDLIARLDTDYDGMPVVKELRDVLRELLMRLRS